MWVQTNRCIRNFCNPVDFLVRKMLRTNLDCIDLILPNFIIVSANKDRKYYIMMKSYTVITKYERTYL